MPRPIGAGTTDGYYLGACLASFPQLPQWLPGLQPLPVSGTPFISPPSMLDCCQQRAAFFEVAALSTGGWLFASGRPHRRPYRLAEECPGVRRWNTPPGRLLLVREVGPAGFRRGRGMVVVRNLARLDAFNGHRGVHNRNDFRFSVFHSYHLLSYESALS